MKIISTGTCLDSTTTAENTDYTTPKLRNVVLSTSEPTSADGKNGDIWIVYEN